MSKLILKHISQLVPVDEPAPIRGQDMNRIRTIEDAFVVTGNHVVLGLGSMEDYDPSLYETGDFRIMDCHGKTLVPGFVDSHTHFIFGGYRENEFKMRLEGKSYMEIMNAGGGIASSVTATRAASLEDLYDLGIERLDGMLTMGVTTVEGKSGYGLDLDTELKQLQVMKELNSYHPIDIVSTFLGPHSLPAEYKGNQEGYIDFVINEVLPEVRDQNLAEFADIFCEKGVFSVAESKYYLSAAKEFGLKLKVHADEMVTLGGTEMAVELGAHSADHLLAVSDQGIQDLAIGKTVATLLPATAYSLSEPFARARDIIDSGCALALATDFNPGSCPTYSIPLVISLAALKMRMTVKEIICALTKNGACAIDRQEVVGSIEVGKKADMLILSKPSIDFLPYHLGMNLVETVIKEGIIVSEKGKRWKI